MNERFLDRLWQQTLTSIATLASICLVAFIVRIVNEQGSFASALAISLFNGAFPEFAKILVKFEGQFDSYSRSTSNLALPAVVRDLMYWLLLHTQKQATALKQPYKHQCISRFACFVG
jgi:hypothetical protein